MSDFTYMIETQIKPRIKSLPVEELRDLIEFIAAEIREREV